MVNNNIKEAFEKTLEIQDLTQQYMELCTKLKRIASMKREVSTRKTRLEHQRHELMLMSAIEDRKK